MLVWGITLGNQTLKKQNLERVKDHLWRLPPRVGMEEVSLTYTFTSEITGYLRRELTDNLNCLD